MLFLPDYDESLEDAIIGDTSGTYKDVCLDLLKGDRDTGSKVDANKAKEDAQNIYQVTQCSSILCVN